VDTLPAWAPRNTEKGWNRFYKSGDLCRYNADGTLEFVSRKDSQIKIRGFRVELGEIEHHIRTTLAGVSQVGVDVIETQAGSKALVAYFCFSNASRVAGDGLGLDGMFLPLTKELSEQLTGLGSELKVILPSYMIPSLWIPCQCMPFITSTKLDRKTLKAYARSLDQDEVAVYSLRDSEKRAPETDLEWRLHAIWAEVQKKPADSIGRDDTIHD
jgi:acyl-coenzyme A synthetase/AMP-(fatty) acid ligase